MTIPWAEASSTFTIFPFAIVLALALGEAFKTTIAEDKFVQWEKLYALGSFLFLILPFYQGMNKYLLVTYGENVPAASRPGAVFLIIDGVAFMIESAFFFVMSRTLGLDQWKRFYWVVAVLLVVDSVWGLTAGLHANGSPVIQSWVKLNVVTVPAILVFLFLFRKATNLHWPAAIGMFGMLVRTVMDYWLTWTFYFPG